MTALMRRSSCLLMRLMRTGEERSKTLNAISRVSQMQMSIVQENHYFNRILTQVAEVKDCNLRIEHYSSLQAVASVMSS